jgi:hypothetical protein
MTSMMAAQYVEQYLENGSEAASDFGDAHNQLLGDNSIQFELPTPQYYTPQQGQPGPDSAPVHGSPPMQSPPPQASPPPMQQSAPPPAPDATPPSGGGGLDGAMQVFLWIAAGIALLILLYWIFAFFRDRRLGGEARSKKARRAGKADGWRPEEGQAVQLLDEADVLANAGRFDEAARLLLHRSIGQIDTHRPDLVRPALTSRDIARHPLLPPGPASAFARIAALVERSLFARRPLGPDDWQDCRVAYREFAFTEGWQR